MRASRRTSSPSASDGLSLRRCRYTIFDSSQAVEVIVVPEAEALNADPTPIENLTVPAVIDHLTDVIGGLERPPILMGHSAGRTFTQGSCWIAATAP
jgi:hypothetical protein